MENLHSNDTLEDYLEKLERRRAEILDILCQDQSPQAMYQQEISNHINTSDKRTKLVEEHNRIVEVQTYPRTSFSPTLPAEIMIECFQQEIDANPDFVYKIILLNQYWAKMAASSAGFWNKLLLDNTDEQYPWKLYTALRLSGDLPLTITLHFSNTERSFNLVHLIEEKHRIDTLIVRSVQAGWARLQPYSPNSDIVDPLTTAFRALGPLPNLKTLTNDITGVQYHTYPSLPYEFLLNYPRLQRLIGCSILSSVIRSLNNYLWEDLTVGSPRDFARDLLPLMRSLKHLRFVPFASRHDDDDHPHLALEPSKCVSKLTIESFHCLYPSFRGDIPLLSFQTLRLLDVTVTWKQLGVFLGSIVTMSSLETFRLRIRESEGDEGTLLPITVIPQLHRVVFFSFSISPPWREDEYASGTEQSFQEFAAIWARLMPNVTSFNYRPGSTSPCDSLILRVRQFQNLHHLNIHFYLESGYLTDWAEFIEASSPETFENLRSIDTNYPDILQLIYAPNLGCVSVSGQPTGEFTQFTFDTSPKLTKATLPVNLVTTLGKEARSNLREIYWNLQTWEPHMMGRRKSNSLALGELSFPISSCTLSLHALENITFASGIDVRDQHEILIAMLESPGLLPQLQHISFSEYPSFALLLRVIFKRNVLRPIGTTFSVIKEIQLPDYPCSSLLSHLSLSLAGKMAPTKVLDEGVPEQDISIYDYKLPGCIVCYNGGISCSVPCCAGENCVQCYNIWSGQGNNPERKGYEWDNWDGESGKNGREYTEDFGYTHSSQHKLNIPDIRWMDGSEVSWRGSNSTWVDIWKKAWSERNDSLESMPGGHQRVYACARYNKNQRVSITGAIYVHPSPYWDT